ncbi:MAG: polymerase, sigma-24 subunit, subfamily [Frankiales bacterium]|nr:polymerase, sigma-24 subunit, subfamily [Frankiales bacterium]
MQDDPAFTGFVHAVLPRMTRFAIAIAGSTDGGEDLVQDSLERLMTVWARVGSTDPEAYLKRMIINRNVSVWRRRREYPAASLPERAYSLDDRRPSDCVWEALRSLSPRQRTVVVLRYYEDMTEEEIARQMGTSLGTVKSQAAKARTRLRACLVDQLEAAYGQD